MAQAPPEHLGVPCDTTQAMAQPPQLFTSVSGSLQALSQQLPPAGQARPQALQSAEASGRQSLLSLQPSAQVKAAGSCGAQYLACPQVSFFRVHSKQRSSVVSQTGRSGSWQSVSLRHSTQMSVLQTPVSQAW